MKRLAVLNNYSLERVWKEVEQRKKPDHHLFGINHFHRNGYDINIIPFKNSPVFSKIDRMLSKSRLSSLVGCLDQQWSTWRHLNSCDLIYAPCFTQTNLLNYMRAIGLLKIPIVCVAHHPLMWGRFTSLRSPFWKLAIGGTDFIPALSQKVAEEINQLANATTKSSAFQWGPDLHYYQAGRDTGVGVVAVGRTGRDFETLGSAASKTSCPTQIICPERAVPPSAKAFSRNVKIVSHPEEESMNYVQLMDIFQSARVMGIPLSPSASLAGLTSLMDALGMGKPVIMTRHPLIDIDIEAEGIGKWVDFGDISGWINAINWFNCHESESVEMGRRARRMVDNGLNSTAFAQKLMNCFEATLAQS